MISGRLIHLLAGIWAFFFCLDTKSANLALAWDPSPDMATPGAITGYKLYYSKQSFSAVSGTNAGLMAIPLGLVTNVVVTNLIGGHTYFFAVTAVSADGAESDISNVASVELLPDLPPLPDDEGVAPEGGSTTTNSTTPSGQLAQTPASTPTAAVLYGQLPRLWLFSTNSGPLLALAGTVGSTLTVQSSTNLADPSRWITVTNVKMMTPADTANPSPRGALENAFVPSLEYVLDSEPVGSPLKFYRVFMPFGYAIVAGQVLAEQGYKTRLVGVRLPGINGYIVCYVNEETAYLDYNDQTFVVKLAPSGPTIREIATKVAASLAQNWTSASEFTVTEGTKQVVATVVQTDSPDLDPALGATQNSTIVIDF